ncbi:DUF2255 family protein [Corynebacterium rouxii]
MWDKNILAAIDAADDLHIAPLHPDGVTHGTPTWIWSVVVDGRLYVRAWNGPRGDRPEGGYDPCRRLRLQRAFRACRCRPYPSHLRRVRVQVCGQLVPAAHGGRRARERLRGNPSRLNLLWRILVRPQVVVSSLQYVAAYTGVGPPNSLSSSHVSRTARS